MAEKTPQKKRSQGRLVLAGVLVGAVAYLIWKRKQAAKAGPSDAIGTLPAAMPAGAESSTTTIGGGPQSFDSITAWMEHVQRWGNSLGFDAATVQSALQAYSTGQCLTSEQYKIIDMALGLFGQPPQAPYQGVVQCQGTGTGQPAGTQPFLGSGYGPIGYDPKQTSPTGTLTSPPTKDETQVLKGLDGSCYSWIPGTEADRAIGSNETRYIEVAPGVFVPNVNPVPAGSAALYLKVPCPAPSGG